MKIKIKRLFPEARVPERGTEKSTGLDVFCHRRLTPDELAVILKSDFCEGIEGYGTGIAAEPPPGYFIQIQPRSSVIKKRFILSNSIGLIDPDYRGEITMIFYTHLSGVGYCFHPGDRMGQMVLMKDYRPEIIEGELSETKRGNKGYGSTGN